MTKTTTTTSKQSWSIAASQLDKKLKLTRRIQKDQNQYQ